MIPIQEILDKFHRTPLSEMIPPDRPGYSMPGDKSLGRLGMLQIDQGHDIRRSILRHLEQKRWQNMPLTPDVLRVTRPKPPLYPVPPMYFETSPQRSYISPMDRDRILRHYFWSGGEPPGQNTIQTGNIQPIPSIR